MKHIERLNREGVVFSRKIADNAPRSSGSHQPVNSLNNYTKRPNDESTKDIVDGGCIDYPRHCLGVW
jgi:hypothetical protein